MPIVYAVSHVMSKPIITVDGKVHANEAIRLMAEKNIGALAVTERGEPGEFNGIVTERDIVRKCCLNASCTQTEVKDIMSKPLITVDGETPIGAAIEVMNTKNIRRLLVTEEGKIVGIVTQKDLMRGTLEAFRAFESALSVA